MPTHAPARCVGSRGKEIQHYRRRRECATDLVGRSRKSCRTVLARASCGIHPKEHKSCRIWLKSCRIHGRRKRARRKSSTQKGCRIYRRGIMAANPFARGRKSARLKKEQKSSAGREDASRTCLARWQARSGELRIS